MNRLSIAFLCLPASLTAQVVSVTFTTAAPLTARAYSATLGLLQQQIVPANQTGLQFLQPTAINAQALSEYGLTGNGTTWHVRAECYEVGPSFAQVMGEVLLHVSATAPVAASIDFVHELTLTAGATGPAFSIDFGDDGIFEVTESTSPTSGTGLLLDPTPFPIRLKAAVTQVGAGVVDLAFGIALAPATAQVNALAPGCAGAQLSAYPTYAGTGVEFTVLAPGPVVLVLGLGLQPQPLPLATAPSCLLLPAPDLLVPLVFPPLPYFTLPLPAAVRPVSVYAQGVLVSAAGLGTTNSFSIYAF